MFKRIREKFGTAGLIVAIVALVVAVAGTAYAATKLNGTQKKEVEKIAKKFAGKEGGTGAPGAKGDTGPQGAPGKEGTGGKDGTSGKSVALVNEAPPLCSTGGYTYEVEGSANENEVCNGKEGPKGPEGVCSTANCVLPTGVIETGTWSFSRSVEEVGGEKIGDSTRILVPISFNIPIAAPIEDPEEHPGEFIHVKGEATFSNFCENGAGNPKPKLSGHVCIYGEWTGTTLQGIYPPESLPFVGFESRQVSRPGGVLAFAPPTADEAEGSGSFAVKG